MLDEITLRTVFRRGLNTEGVIFPEKRRLWKLYAAF